MTNTTPTQQLFAALKPEDSSSQKSTDEATHAAEQRWPLLKSLTPEKWAIAPALSEEEKLHRNRLAPIEVVNRKPAASAPNLNAQIANALNRMSAPTQVPITKTLPTAVQIPTSAPLFKPASTPEQQTSKPSDDSILSVLQRVAKANEPEPVVTEKASGFLSRLGKR
jgi:hypothetical protein